MENKIKISGIIFEHDKDDYGLWEGFYLTEDEENQIMEILMNHDTEGCSIRGTRKEISEEIGGVIKMYKLRIYKLSGVDKGNLDHEEMFDTKEQMDKRYDELFKRELYILNPTAWKQNNNGWKRLEGY